MVDYGDRIFENYELYLKDHRDDIGTASGAIEMLSSDGAFHAYIDALTEGLDAYTKRSIMGIAEREREMLLEESINIGPSAAVVGYAVSYFPILTDIYSDPIISQIATTFPVNKSIITIPRVSIKSTVKNTDGTTSSYRLPTLTDLVRTTNEDIDFLPNVANYAHALSASSALINPDNTFLNKRYFVVKSINYTSDGTPGTIPVMIRPDSRGQLNYTTEFTEPVSSEKVTVTIIGNVNWDTQSVQYNATFNNPTGTTVQTITSITSNVVFSARTGDIGRVRVELEMEGWDVNIDVRDSFEIKLDQEVIQDYNDIYQIDMIRTLSMAIKHQMLYNKDYDLAWMLQVHEPQFAAAGSSSTYDLAKYLSSGVGNLTPASIIDVFRGIVPHITNVNRNIRKMFRADPQYLVTGSATASLLESLQAYMVGFQTTRQGEAGFSSQNSAIDFRKQIILASEAVPDNKIYPVYRAPNDDLARTALVDLIYKPLYIIEEIDNSQRRTFVKSRTAIELTNPDAMGVITMENYEDYL